MEEKYEYIDLEIKLSGQKQTIEKKISQLKDDVLLLKKKQNFLHKIKLFDDEGRLEIKFNLKKVEDVIRYQLECIKNKDGKLEFKFIDNLIEDIEKINKSKFNDYSLEKIGDRIILEKNIVILLESPHKDEYQFGQPIAPAQSSTGRGIEQNILNKLNNLCSEYQEKELLGKYNIVIANPIQYQTSLGINTIIARDEIWKKLFSKLEYRNYFQKRIGKYNPYLIINACTNGNKKPTLKEEVSNFLLEKKEYREKIYEIAHPAYNGWNRFNLKKKNILT